MSVFSSSSPHLLVWVEPAFADGHVSEGKAAFRLIGHPQREQIDSDRLATKFTSVKRLGCSTK